MRIHPFLIPCLVLLFCLPAQADEARTAGRTASGLREWPAALFQRQEHDEFLSYDSYQDPHHRHPMQWQGQDWDPSAWNSEKWAPKIVVQKFFDNGIFAGQYALDDKIQAISLGPRFYKLSDLDRRRALKLLTDTTGTFKSGYATVELRDWWTRAVVGSYSPKGMFLK